MRAPVPVAGPRRAAPSLRIIGVLSLLLITLWLQACSTVTLGYNRAQGLVYWWLDGVVDLSDEQSGPVRDGLAALHQWHRRESLPQYAQLLRRWEGMATQDITPAQACTEFERARDLLLTVKPRAIPLLVPLAQTMSPEQVAHMQRHHQKSNQRFRDDFMADPKKALDLRAKRLRDRLEMFYGPLDRAQQTALREALAASRFDAAVALAERQRRQADMVATVAQVRGQPVDVARQAIEATAQRLVVSPSADYRAQAQGWQNDACALFASAHNRMTPDQRKAAAQTLADYANDFLTLAGQD